MLVVSRKLGESIRIGNNIVLTVVRVGPHKIRIGIEAPREVPVFREELVAMRGSEELARQAREAAGRAE